MINPRKILSNLKRALFGFMQNKEELAALKTSEPRIIGYSKNQKPINCYEIGDRGLKILIVGGIHGNEVGTVKLAHRIINWLAEKPFPNLEILIIPCLNPDGFQKAINNPDYFCGGKIGRTNSNNVDLNRNFPTSSFASHAKWPHGKNYSEITEVFAGDFAGSELEVQSLIKLIDSENFGLVFSLHNAGSDILGNPIGNASSLAEDFSKKANYHFMTDTDWKKFGQTGSSYEWFTAKRIPFIEIEASSRWSSDWERQKGAIEELFYKLNNGN